MQIYKILFAAVSAAIISAPTDADVLRGTGSPMSMDLGYGLTVNDGSSLLREWVIVNDERLPVHLNSFSVRTQIDDRNWVYDVQYEFEALQEIQAIEIRFIPFNIWGESERALSTTEVKDFGAGTSSLRARWRILSENDAIEHYAMLGYVAQVKLSSGQILRANADNVVEEARRFSEDFTSGDLSAED